MSARKELEILPDLIHAGLVVGVGMSVNTCVVERLRSFLRAFDDRVVSPKADDDDPKDRKHDANPLPPVEPDAHRFAHGNPAIQDAP